MITQAATTALAFASKLPDLLRASRSDSLIEYTQPTRVEPIVLMDDRVVTLPYAGDVMQSLSSVFAGYYLQAIALSVNVGRVDVIKLLDKLNPNRNLDENAIAGATMLQQRMSLEDANAYAFGLPVPGQAVGLEHFGLEARSVYEYFDRKDGGKDDAGKPDGLTSADDAMKVAREATNLSVGKLLEVEIESDGHKAVFPVSVRLIATATSPKGVVHTLSVGSKNNKTMAERFHMWRAGQLDFWKDLVMCQDLIDDHKEGLLKDTTGVYSSTIKRRNKNRISAILSGQPSVATASNMIVMDQETAKELERNISGRLKDFKTRQKIFKETYAMIIVVINQDWDQVTFYHRGIDTPSEMSIGELKSINKSKGPDVAEILKAYQLGNAPSL